MVPLLLLLLAFVYFRYTSKYHKFRAYEKRDGIKATPLTFPYLPPLGNLPITYLLQPRDFVLNRTSFFQCAHPVRVKIFTYEVYVVRGPDNIKALFKNSWACTSIPFVKFALGYAFGLPRRALNLYDKDDSGGGHVPHPEVLYRTGIV
ncbi:hypothetical protein SLS60_003581 [Paraconiothyrium brasiliense]|uniref:Cytochrome P450 n=1 Tax=Paraconiothyrium brasiliense TaxID=300254 RepID=A0ABR3RP36_9PLEO